MTLTEFYDTVARRADTDKTKISAAETRRVLSEGFLVLAGLNAVDLAAVLNAGLSHAAGKAGGNKTGGKKPAHATHPEGAGSKEPTAASKQATPKPAPAAHPV